MRAPRPLYNVGGNDTNNNMNSNNNNNNQLQQRPGYDTDDADENHIDTKQKLLRKHQLSSGAPAPIRSKSSCTKSTDGTR